MSQLLSHVSGESLRDLVADYIQRLGLLEPAESIRKSAVDSGSNSDLRQATTHFLDTLLQQSSFSAVSNEPIRSEANGTSNSSLSVHQRKVDPAVTQIVADASEIEHRINNFINKKREEIDDSNRNEFVARPPNLEEPFSARTHAAAIHREQQMKTTLVTNSHGPQSTTFDSSPIVVRDGLVDRIGALEAHLHLAPSPVPLDVYSSIKRLEDRLLSVERVTTCLTENPDISSDIKDLLKQLTAAPPPPLIYRHELIQQRNTSVSSAPVKSSSSQKRDGSGQLMLQHTRTTRSTPITIAAPLSPQATAVEDNSNKNPATRSASSVASSPITVVSTLSDDEIAMDMLVFGRLTDGQWYPGVVTNIRTVNNTRLFRILFDDQYEKDLSIKELRRREPSSPVDDAARKRQRKWLVD